MLYNLIKIFHTKFEMATAALYYIFCVVRSSSRYTLIRIFDENSRWPPKWPLLYAMSEINKISTIPTPASNTTLANDLDTLAIILQSGVVNKVQARLK